MKLKEILLLAGVLALDMLTKFWVQSTMTLGQSIPVIRGFFNITYAQNTGAAWSLLEGKMMFFYIITTVAVVGFSWYLWKTDKKETWTRLATVLVIGGALGNLIDRVAFHYVRDFLDFIIFGYDFPIFNVADMALCVGVEMCIRDRSRLTTSCWSSRIIKSSRNLNHCSEFESKPENSGFSVFLDL